MRLFTTLPCFPALLSLQALVVNGQDSTPSCTPKTEFFTQLVDHNSTTNGTFQQQFQLIDSHFKPGGPIFYYQQAETASFACLERTIYPEWAQETGGMVISLEHRFFGLSDASKNITDPIEKYKSLTLENVMLDAVTFVNHIKNTVPGANHSKVIVSGGSYGGFLTTVLKMNYPQVFFGAVPYAAPLRSVGANYQNPRRYDWFNWVAQVYWDLSAAAATKMRNAFTLLAQRFETLSEVESIAKDLNLCTVPKTTSDLQLLMGVITSNAQEIPLLSYSSPDANPYGATPEKMVNISLSAKKPIDIVNATLTLRNPPNLVPCISWESDDSTEATLQKAPFNYLLCKYFPLSTNEILKGNIYPPTAVQTESDPMTCETLYKIVPPTQAEVEAKWHISRADLIQAPRIIFAYAENDPTTSVGIDPFPPSPDRNASRWMITSLAAHGEESIASFSGDKPSVVHARRVQLETIKEWLGLY
ncbi:serine carboxypeptidase S28 domain-containing protein [Trichoderma sp. SZMC 28014]